jgi:acyl-CoA synthetase (AMP-forming)/AMP-acid ligase II
VLRIPDIVSAAAVGIDDLEAGERISVFITIRPGAVVTPDSVLEHCRNQLAKYMVPSVVTIIGSLPMNSNGKVVKAELRRMASK